MIEILALVFGTFRFWFPVLLLIGFCLFFLVPFAKFGLRHERKLLNPIMWFAVLGLSGALLYYGYRVAGAAVLVLSAGYWLVMLITNHGSSVITVEAGRLWLFNAAIFLAFFFVTDMASVPHRKMMALENRADRPQAFETATSKEKATDVVKTSDQLWK